MSSIEDVLIVRIRGLNPMWIVMPVVIMVGDYNLWNNPHMEHIHYCFVHPVTNKNPKLDFLNISKIGHSSQIFE